MRIRGATFHHVAVPLHEPFRIASGAVAVKDAIIIELLGDDGVIGLGEASPMAGGFYSVETPASTWNYLEHTLLPALFANEEISFDDAIACVNSFSDEPFARAGIEGALWDAHARERNAPLYTLLGGENRRIPSGVGIGLFDTIDELLDRVARFLAEGYVRVKIKIEPGWDVEPLRAVRARFGDIPLMVDANASYTLSDHADVLRALDQFDLIMIEQPLAKHAFDDAATLQRMIATPLCADESAYSLDAVNLLIASGSARILNIKVQRVGGLANAKRIADRALAAGVPCWLGTMPELGVASMQGIHLATHPAFTYPTDVEASARWYVADIIAPPITIDAHGTIAPGKFVIDRTALARYTLATQTFSR